MKLYLQPVNKEKIRRKKDLRKLFKTEKSQNNVKNVYYYFLI